MPVAADESGADSTWGHIWGHLAKPELHLPFSSNYLEPQFNSARLHHLFHIPDPSAE